VERLPDRDTLLTVIGSAFDGSAFDGSAFDGSAFDGSTPGDSRVWVSVLTVRDGGLDDRLIPLATTDADTVRTVPLLDGRVALVAGDSVSFLAV
jgi:hypothetical protein